MLYFRRGKSGLWLVPTITAVAAPTVAQIAAGINLSKTVIAVNNFETQVNRLSVGVMYYSTELQLAGPQQFQDASLVITDDDGTGSDGDSTARQAAIAGLTDSLAAYLVFSKYKPGALVATDKVEVWPIQVVTQNTDWTLDPAAARINVPVVVTSPPTKNAVVAA
jgi:hypothetical protein